MKRLHRYGTLLIVAGLATACLAAGSPPAPAPAPASTPAPAPQASPTACLEVETNDDLTRQFADRLREAIAASGALRLASTSDSCDLQLHVPGNLLRFETAGGVLVGTVVIVTSASGHYLATSIAACQANDFAPCATRAVAAAKLARLMTANDGA